MKDLKIILGIILVIVGFYMLAGEATPGSLLDESELAFIGFKVLGAYITYTGARMCDIWDTIKKNQEAK